MQGVDEPAVAHTVLTDRSVDARGPKSAKVILLVASMRESMVASVQKGYACFTKLCTAGITKTLGSLQDVASSFEC